MYQLIGLFCSLNLEENGYFITFRYVMIDLSPDYKMLVEFGEVREFKEQLIECKRCKKEYPTNIFVIISNQTYPSNGKKCREDLGRGGRYRRSCMRVKTFKLLT